MFGKQTTNDDMGSKSKKKKKKKHHEMDSKIDDKLDEDQPLVV